MPIRRHVGAQQVGRTTATAFLLNSTYQFWNLVPAIFLDWTMMHHNGYHFVELFLCKKRTSRILSINCGVQSSTRFEMVWMFYRSKHQVSHVRQIQNQTASLCFWPARPPQIAEGVAFSDKLCSFEFGICSQSGFCETSGIGTLAKFVSKETQSVQRTSLTRPFE